MKYCLIFFAAWFSILSVHALVIKGTANTEKLEPLPGIFINAYNSAEVYQGGVTDARGQFIINIDCSAAKWILIQFEDGSRTRVGITFNHLNIQGIDTLVLDKLIFRKHLDVKQKKDTMPKFRQKHIRKLEKEVAIYVNDIPFLMTLNIKYQCYYADCLQFPNWHHK